MNRALHVCCISVLLLPLTPRFAPGLDLVLDVAGVGSVSIADNEIGKDSNPADGTIDFSETFGGQFQAQGRARGVVGVLGRSVSISATPPATDAVFRNTDVVDRDFTFTVNHGPFDPSGPPLGWSVNYTGSADDPTPDAVDIPSHSVTLDINDPAQTVAVATGTAITVADEIDVGSAGEDDLGSADRMTVTFAFTAGPGDEILLPEDEQLYGLGIFARVFNQQDQCIDKLNNRARQVVKKTAKAAEKCVKTVASSAGGPSAQCTTDLASDKIQDAQAKLLDTFNSSLCTPVPAWGVNDGPCCDNGDNESAVCLDSSPDCDVGGTCTPGACISGAATNAMKDLALDIFGGTALIGVEDVGKCQRAVVQAAGKVLDTRWKVFRKCKKSTINTIDDDVALVAACLGPPQVDSGKIVSAETKLVGKINSKCINSGVLPVGSAFPGGRCSDELDANFAACVNVRAACRLCRGVNEADDIDPAVDCDLFDDGAANASCP